jgi:hypothetical protein
MIKVTSLRPLFQFQFQFQCQADRRCDDANRYDGDGDCLDIGYAAS